MYSLFINPTKVFQVVLLPCLIFISGCSSDSAKISDYVEGSDTVMLKDNWEKAIPYQEIPDGLTSLSAESCGSCHSDHYKEWQFSTHSHAWTDLQFQAELKKESSPYVCINCHIPLENQQKYLISGLIDGDYFKPIAIINERFDPQLQLEGINCASCHVRDGYVIGPTGTSKAPHKTRKDNVHLSEQLCISCHNAVETVSADLVCSFETGNEWMESSHAHEGKNCISCHMPDTVRSIVPGYPPRKSRYHYFPGSGIPKFADKPTKMLNGLEIIVHPIKSLYKFGSEAIFTVELTNKHAGHKVPTGDPERFVLVKFSLHKKDNSIIDEKTFRIGEEWEWYPEAKKLSDNNLMPGESRIFKYSKILNNYEIEYLEISIAKYRTTEEIRKINNIDSSYPVSVMIFRQRFKINLKQ